MEKGMIGMMAIEMCERLGVETTRNNRDWVESFLETALTAGLQTSLLKNHENLMKIYNQREELRNLSRACMRKSVLVKKLRADLEMLERSLLDAEKLLEVPKPRKTARKAPKPRKTAKNGSEKLQAA